MKFWNKIWRKGFKVTSKQTFICSRVASRWNTISLDTMIASKTPQKSFQNPEMFLKDCSWQHFVK